MDQSPAGAVGKGRGKGQRKPRKPKAGPMHVNPMPIGQNIPLGGQTMAMGVQSQTQMGHGMGGYGPQGSIQVRSQYSLI